jgi:hypothetical protein
VKLENEGEIMRILICTLVACALLGSAYAELQNVQVYGRIDIRARYYKSSFNNASVLGGGPALETRIPAMFLPASRACSTMTTRGRTGRSPSW